MSEESLESHNRDACLCGVDPECVAEVVKRRRGLGPNTTIVQPGIEAGSPPRTASGLVVVLRSGEDRVYWVRWEPGSLLPENLGQRLGNGNVAHA